MIDQEMATAYHEAGHAVAAEEVGYEVTSVVAGDHPETRYGVPMCDRDSDASRLRQLTVIFAGRVAQAAWLDRLDYDHGLIDDALALFDEFGADATPEAIEGAYGEIGDMAAAFLLVARMERDEARAELKLALDSAREIIRDEWSEVEAWAGTLAPTDPT
jgi:hypothetical protein